MKNQREIYEALLAGETLVDVTGVQIKLNEDGMLENLFTGKVWCYFGRPIMWKIFMDNAPE